MKCPSCQNSVFVLSNDGERLRAATTMVILHKSGEVEINCPTCKNGVILPLAVTGSTLKKGRAYRPVVFSRRDLTGEAKSGQ